MTCAATPKSLGVLLSEGRPTQRPSAAVRSRTRDAPDRQTRGPEPGDGCQALGGGVTFRGLGLYCGMNVLDWTEDTAAQHCGFFKCHRMAPFNIVHLCCVNFSSVSLCVILTPWGLHKILEKKNSTPGWEV